MQQHNILKDERSAGLSNQARGQKLKEIDALYRAQIKQIYTESRDKLEKKDAYPQKPSFFQGIKQSQVQKQSEHHFKNVGSPTKHLQSAKSVSTLNVPQSQSSSKMLNSGSEAEQKVRASVFLRGESTRTIEILRRENETKELKIRQLSNKCQNLIQKLKRHLPQQQFEAQILKLQQFSDNKMQRLEHLLKIKHEEIFFKIKLQVIGLLQEFAIPKEELAEFNQVSSQSSLYTLMSRKLKSKLKDFRSKEQESSFQIQRDKILNQKQEQRIHYLTETNELLKLSQQKLKNKIEDLKLQLNEYLDKLKLRERENQQNENEVFRLRKQNQQLQAINQRLNNALNSANNQKIDERRIYEAKQKQMKSLLNNYFVQKKKLETDLQERQGDIQELLIKQKFLEQQNQRINRELIRWKERFEWLEKDKEAKLQEAEEERISIINNFQQYKLENNQGILMSHRADIEQALRKVQEYQRAYERVVLELEQERRLLQRSEGQAQQKLQQFEMQWLQRVKSLEKIKDEQLQEITMDCEARITEMREKYEKNQQLHAQEMQARLKTLLAEKDKKSTEQMIELQSQNQQLRREITDLNKIIEVKQSLINVINNKKALS